MAVVFDYGAAPTYVKLASQTPGAVASVTFSNIPQGYTDLVLVVNGFTSNSNVGDNVGVRFNGDSGSNYSWMRTFAVGTTASTRSSSQTVLGQAAIGGGAALPSTITYNIQNYSNANTYKTVLYKSNDGVTQVTLSTGVWQSFSPITSVNINTYASGVNFGSTTTFTIYGIKAAFVPKATGGDIIVQDGTYWYHAFKNSGTFSTRQSLTVDYLVIAGGGSGGYFAGGGGGAGGLRSTVTATGGGGTLESAISLNANTTYTATIGAGGAGTRYTRANGSNTSFSTITATGGGAGGARATENINGLTGGSGGGGGNATGSGASSGSGGGGTANQGYAGGTGYSDNATFVASGGGGGAGAIGGSRSGTTVGSGGAGVLIPSFAGATATGVNGYYAGGGAGGYYAATPGTGGLGGGGNANVAGVPNTGGGGGGPVDGAANLTASGGSGLVIVRYLI